jgi:hypothetical protein
LTRKPDLRLLRRCSILSAVSFSFLRRNLSISWRKISSSGAKSMSSGTAWKTPSRVKTPRDEQE